jgi:anti-sigma factor RsiW
MNCEQFQDKLFEYVDGTLSASELDAAQKHLSGCSACRKPVQEEQRRAQALTGRLQQSGQSLTLRPEIVRNILAAARAARPAATESFTDLWMRWLRRAAIPAAFLVIVACMLIRTEIQAPVAIHVSTPTTINHQQPAVSIEMSYRLPRHEFHQEGNLVLDTLVEETVVVNGAIPSGGSKNLPQQKFEIKTPL